MRTTFGFCLQWLAYLQSFRSSTADTEVVYVSITSQTVTQLKYGTTKECAQKELVGK